MRLILASRSPRREELLRHAGFDFDVRPSGVNEGEPVSGEPPEAYARRIARAKALSVAARSPAGAWVLGADTVVTLSGLVLGKPHGASDAARMLRLLSGQTHQVMTAICLVRAPSEVAALKHETTSVAFRKLSDDEIRDYVARPEPYDKAGAYAIQGYASSFVEHISGCYSNVVGLPIPLLSETIKDCSDPTSERQS